jgi:Uncharacterized conserved protein (DUF2304)
VPAVLFSVTLLAVVLELARRRQLVEEYSLLWIGLGVALLAMSIRRGAMRVVVAWLRLDHLTPSAVMAGAACACAVALWISVVMSRQRRQIERLTEETAILSAELRDLRSNRPR